MRTLSVWFAITVGVVLAAYIGFATWRTASLLSTILRVGSPIAQGEGAPEPQRPQDIGYAGDPRMAFGYAFQTISLESDLGPLPAWLIPADDASRSWAVFVHGIGGRRENGYRFLPVLRAAGLTTLMISYRNDREAPPAPDGLYALGLTEWRDLDVAVEYALAHGAHSVVIVAESMGGAIAGQYLRNGRRRDSVSALVLDAPMVDLPLTLSNLVGRLGVPLPRTIATLALRVADQRYAIRLVDAVVVDEIEQFPGSVFLSHGSADRIVPIEGSDALASGRGDRITYLRTAADHILSWAEDPPRYEQVLGSFLRAIVASASEPLPALPADRQNR